MDTKIPLVSVIIPMYNKASQIERCLRSLQHQTYSNYEVLVIDDGSTDNSYYTASKYNSENIRIYSKKNGGVSSARNYGIDIAKGDYVVFVDSDDWVKPEYISNFFKLTIKPTSAICIQAIECECNNKISVLGKYDDCVLQEKDFCEYMSKYELLHNGYPFAKLYDREILNKYGIRFNQSLPTHEDHVFVLDYMDHINKIILCRDASYKYLLDENPESLSKKLYSPEIFLKASDVLMDGMNRINSRFKIKKDYFWRALTDYGLTQRLRAILSSYIKGYSRNYRLDLLRQEFRHNKKLYANYKSKRILQDAIVKLMLYFPVEILDFAINSTVSIMGLKGKNVRLYIR